MPFHLLNGKLDSNVGGVYSTSVKELEGLKTTADKHADVTKGMEGKIDTIKNIARKGIDTVLLNGNKPNRLYSVLVGEDTKCTIVCGVVNESD